MNFPLRTIFWGFVTCMAVYRLIWTFIAMWNYYSLDFPIDFGNLYISGYEFIHGLPIYDEAVNRFTWLRIANSLGIESIVMPGKPNLLFIYPPQIAVVFSPFVFISFEYAVWIWYLILILSYFAIAYTMPRVFESTVGKATIGLELLLLIFAFKFTKGSFTVGQPAYLVFLIGIASLWFFKRNKVWYAGLFLGLATIKPTVVLPFFYFMPLNFGLEKKV